jgi:hypothetical protein
MRKTSIVLVMVLLMGTFAPAAVVTKDKVADVYQLPELGSIKIGGMLGDRMKVNLEQRLLNVDEAGILGGFQKRPGSHPWIGEHVGKFLHAAVNTWLYSKDARLKEKMDRVATELMKCQMPDGYLGTYSEDKRWTSWDVWVHKYNLIGLLAYYDATGNEQALKVCRGVGDLMLNTFGDGQQGTKSGRDIGKAGEHMGMAATSILEPMCELYRRTADKQYLDFCLYITRALESNAHVVSSLTEKKRVYGTANNKAYEMLSNLVGLTELYRITGDEQFLTPAINAWEDIVARRLYITGTTSSHEHFQADDHLPGGEGDDVGEGCVTVTWMQLNLSLLRLKGEAKYADQLERTIYNQLIAAQEKSTGDICYFTPLMGTKKPGHEINCCLSSEPRGISMIPLAAVGRMRDGVVVNLYEQLDAKLDSSHVEVLHPVKLGSDSLLEPAVPDALNLMVQNTPHVLLRRPKWASKWSVPDAKSDHSYERVDLSSGQMTLDLNLSRELQRVAAGANYPDHVALLDGPQVLCFDASESDTYQEPVTVAVERIDGRQILGKVSLIDGAKREFTIRDLLIRAMPVSEARSPHVWLLKEPQLLPTGPAPVTFSAKQSQSRPGNMPSEGSITDLSINTFRSTRNGQLASEDWFAVEMEKPANISRVVYGHGTTQPQGGWFDTSSGKPRIEYKAMKDGEWKKLGELTEYPTTNAKDDPNLQSGQPFELKLEQPVEAIAIRVIGKPANGNRPKRSFVTCSELQAYEK